MDEQRERTLQQRQIAEEIHRRKRADDRTSSMDEEQLLLSLIRAIDAWLVRRPAPEQGRVKEMNDHRAAPLRQRFCLFSSHQSITDFDGYCARSNVVGRSKFTTIM